MEQAVSFGGEMGLLDDAIREHMDLKRRRGADPGEVARIERDALGPVVRSHDDAAEETAFEDGEVALEDDEHGGHAVEEDHPARGPDFAHVGQETAELDMRTVLDAQPQDGSDSLEVSPEAPSVIPGQERLWFDQEQGSRDFDFDP